VNDPHGVERSPAGRESVTGDFTHDVIVIGGGPAGSTAARTLAQKGFRVVVLEREAHPKFHIGESFLPRNYKLLCDLGLRERLEQIPQTLKLGAEFSMGHDRDPSSRFRFSQMLGNEEHRAFNIERAPFDRMLFDAARDAGAEMREDTPVKRIVRLNDFDVAVETPSETLRARFLIDGSGQGTVVARHLKIRRVLEHHQKIAYFGHFKNVDWPEGEEAGSPSFAVCREGWIWLIPLDETRTSIGLVMDAKAAKSVDHPADRMLFWAIERCPFIRKRLSRSEYPEKNHVCADFSYRCEPYAGPGYFLVGDAAAFIDPIFSTGVCLSMMSAIQAAESINAMLRDGTSPARERRRYIKYINGSSSHFFRLIDWYYRQPFRELFLSGSGPLQVHSATIALLAGNVFPKPSFAVRWRMQLFQLFIWIQRYYPLAPRREDFSLLEAPDPPPGEPTAMANAEYETVP
jgi:flavin-dependent dehydrogenase